MEEDLSGGAGDDRPPILEKLAEVLGTPIEAKKGHKKKSSDPTRGQTQTRSQAKSTTVTGTNSKIVTFKLVPNGSPALVDLPQIPKKSAQDKRLDRLEALLVSQAENNQSFKDSLMSTLSLEQKSNAKNPKHDSRPTTHWGRADPGEDMLDWDGEEEYDYEEDYTPYSQSQFHSISDEEEDVLVSEDKPDEDGGKVIETVKPQTEVLAAAVSNETEIGEEPTGFASKFANVTVGASIDPGMATSMEYLMRNKLAEKPLNEVLENDNTP